MSFNQGDRVMVVDFDKMGYSVDLSGFYGHVTAEMTDPVALVEVILEGCVASAPSAADVDTLRGDRFPFYPKELQHAD
jgi:hypothetical protein